MYRIRIFMVLIGISMSLLACNSENTDNSAAEDTEATNASLKEIVEKDEAGRITEKYYLDTIRDIRQGAYSLYYPDGSILEEGMYVDGKLDGAQKIYHPNGKLQTEAQLKAGRFEGPYRSYHENGELAQEVVFKDNKQEGELRNYYDNGQLREVVQFENGLEKGSFVEYHRNGEVAYKGAYLLGESSEDGLLEEFDSTGTLIRKAQCDSGICETTWRLADKSN